MAKSIIKEAGIVILLLLAVALILGIIFYEYIPSNKTIPVEIKEYALSEDIENELKESIIEGQNIVKTLYISDDDLYRYESTNNYDKGKANPFADYTAKSTSSENTTNPAGSTNNDSVSNNTTNINQNSNDNNGQNTQSDSRQNEVYINTPGKNY